MRVDEKIAELERIRRMKEQLEQAEQDVSILPLSANVLTS